MRATCIGAGAVLKQVSAKSDLRRGESTSKVTRSSASWEPNLGIRTAARGQPWGQPVWAPVNSSEGKNRAAASGACCGATLWRRSRYWWSDPSAATLSRRRLLQASEARRAAAREAHLENNWNSLSNGSGTTTERSSNCNCSSLDAGSRVGSCSPCLNALCDFCCM